jgi:DNA polymerase III sliding clamp (beta) subunit (PCNA family)
MKFAAKAGLIAEALALATTAVRLAKKQPDKPNLSDSAVRIAAIEGRVGFCCYDRNVSVSAYVVPAAVIEPGVIATDAVRTLELFSNFKRDVSPTMTDGTVTHGDGRRYRLPVIPDHRLVDLPELPEPVAGDGFDQIIALSSNEVLTLIGPLWAAANVSSGRTFFNSVFLQTVDYTLTATSTDGAKLARVAIKAPPFSRGRDLILPEPTAVTIRKLLKHDKPSAVEIRRSKNLIAISTPRFRLVSRLIDHVYPEVERVIPRETGDVVTIERTELLSALGRMRATATNNADAMLLVVLAWDHGAPFEVYLAQQPGDGIDVFEDAITEGRARFALSLRLLALTLEAIESEQVEIIGSSPARIRAVGDTQKFVLVSHCHFAFAEAA